jgi:hypothetical protein
MFTSDVKARHDKMVGFTRRVVSDKRGTMSTGHSRTAEPTETMMTADSLRLLGLASMRDETRQPNAER